MVENFSFCLASLLKMRFMVMKSLHALSRFQNAVFPVLFVCSVSVFYDIGINE